MSTADLFRHQHRLISPQKTSNKDDGASSPTCEKASSITMRQMTSAYEFFGDK